MAVKLKQFSDKFNSLSPEAQFYFSSELSGQSILALAAAYKIDANYIYNLVFDAVNQDFDLIGLRKELSAFNLTGLAEKDLFQDFIGKILLPISPYITGQDIKSELIKNGGDPELYQDNVDKFSDLIEKENFKNLDDLVDLYEKTVNPQEEKEYALDVLANHLMEALASDSVSAAAALNGGLIYLLNNDKNFIVEATQVLLANNYSLTAVRLSIADKEVTPTVANWLKDFIKINGSEIFNDLTLAQYLSSSPNAKSLNSSEKILVGKLLKLYRNLVFFPESLNDVPLADWEIIPTDQAAEKKLGRPGKVQDVLSEENEAVRVNSSLSAVAPTPTPTLASDLATSTAMSNSVPAPDPISELEQTLGNYSSSGLEYKAIKQEINRLKVGNFKQAQKPKIKK